MTTKARSALMKRIRRTGTRAEQRVGRLLHRLGARFRKNVGQLPGSPDIANRTKKKAIFVHGCFWHHHAGWPRGRVPKTNTSFWLDKLEGNRRRDRSKERQLRELGFDVLVVWECQLEAEEELSRRLNRFWFD